MSGANNPLKNEQVSVLFWKPRNAGPSDKQVPFLVPKISTQNETLDSDIEERCRGGGGSNWPYRSLDEMWFEASVINITQHYIQFEDNLHQLGATKFVDCCKPKLLPISKWWGWGGLLLAKIISICRWGYILPSESDHFGLWSLQCILCTIDPFCH